MSKRKQETSIQKENDVKYIGNPKKSRASPTSENQGLSVRHLSNSNDVPLKRSLDRVFQDLTNIPQNMHCVCTVFNLTKNMRLLSNNLKKDEAKDIDEFSWWILNVGDGKLAEPNDGDAIIDIPEEFLINSNGNPIDSITREEYGDPKLLHKRKLPDYDFYQSRAILCPTNEDVNIINDYMLDNLEGEEIVFLSSDSLEPSDTSSTNNPVLTRDFLNSVKVSGLPNHSLRLKIGCPVMLLRNIDTKGGLMNGTRLQIIKMAEFIVQAVIITEDKVGEIIFIPRLLITPSDLKLPFKMRRRQLPLVVAFAITINKSQGESLENVGLFLPRPCFSHGQLYVAVSRVTSKKGLKVLIVDKDGNQQKKTKNVVYKEVFRNIKTKLEQQARTKT